MFGDRNAGVFVGVDVAKERHWAQALSPQGVGLFEGSVANDQAAVEALLDRAEAAAGGRGVVLVVDMVSSAALPLLAVAAERGTPVAYVSGLRMRRAAQLYEGEAKTDPKDAWALADYARRNADRLTWVETTDRSLARMKVLCGHDEDLACDQTRQHSRLREAILSVCPALERVLGSRLTCLGVLDVLGKYPSPALMRKAGRARLRNLIHKRPPLKLSTKASQQIWEALKTQTVTLPATDTWAETIPHLTQQLQQTLTRRKQIQATLTEELKTNPLGEVLATIPGFGPRTTPKALTEIGNPHRFANGAKLASYAGLAPTDRRSGRTPGTTTHNRGGNHRLKNATHPSRLRRHPTRPTRQTLQIKPNDNKAKPTAPPSPPSPAATAHHPHHPQNPNPLQPKTNLTNRQEHPPWGPSTAAGSRPLSSYPSDQECQANGGRYPGGEKPASRTLLMPGGCFRDIHFVFFGFRARRP